VAEDPVVRLQDVTKTYSRTLALRSVNLEIRAGEVFGYLGPNGAGKTTTLRLLMGLLRATSGRVEVLGLDAWRDAVTVHRRVGYVPGEPALYERLTGREHTAYFGHLRRDAAAKRAAELAGRLDLDLDRPSRQLSKGNRQKLALVLALMSSPRLLVLDEPTSGLDPIVQQEFHALLREHTAAGGTVLLSSHVLAEVQRVADRVGVLRAGQLVAVEQLEDLRAASLHHIAAQLTEPVDRSDFATLPGVRDLTVSGCHLTCSAPQSALDGVLKAVARHSIVDFECAEADLDETFLAYYGAGGSDDA
jgi:ABC-2 type transport system ATP-binding protein